MKEIKHKKGAFCIRAASQKSSKGCISPKHNIRDAEYMQEMKSSDNPLKRAIVEDIDESRSKNNLYYSLDKEKSLDEYEKEAKERYTKSIGQSPSKKTMFIRPFILNVNSKVTIEKIEEMGKIVKEMTGMTLLKAAFHADEGHWHYGKNNSKYWVGNYHIHADFLSQHLEDWEESYKTFDKKTGNTIERTTIVKAGRTCRNLPFSEMQTRLAEVFGMERGFVKNDDPAAFLNPRLKNTSQQGFVAAQIMKAKRKLIEVNEEIADCEEREKEAEYLIKRMEAVIKGNDQFLSEQSREYELLKDKLRKLPGDFHILRYIQEIRDRVYDTTESLVNLSFPGKLIGMARRLSEKGAYYEEILMENDSEEYSLRIYESSGNIYKEDKHRHVVKQKPLPELSEYLRAEISDEMYDLLGESIVAEKLKSKKISSVKVS